MRVTPFEAHAGLCRFGDFDVGRRESGVAHHADLALDALERLSGYLEDGGGEVPGDPVVALRPGEPRREEARVERLAA